MIDHKTFRHTYIIGKIINKNLCLPDKFSIPIITNKLLNSKKKQEKSKCFPIVKLADKVIWNKGEKGIQVGDWNQGLKKMNGIQVKLKLTRLI